MAKSSTNVKTYTDRLLDNVRSFLELRASDPWPDELWPAANIVLKQIAEELRRGATIYRFIGPYSRPADLESAPGIAKALAAATDLKSALVQLKIELEGTAAGEDGEDLPPVVVPQPKIAQLSTLIAEAQALIPQP